MSQDLPSGVEALKGGLRSRLGLFSPLVARRCWRSTAGGVTGMARKRIGAVKNQGLCNAIRIAVSTGE